MRGLFFIIVWLTLTFAASCWWRLYCETRKRK